MNLIEPLTLEDAKTENLNLVPTKKFFKPVLLSIPLVVEDALRIDGGPHYLFDPNGNPYPFEGTHRVAGELPGADVTFIGKVTPAVTLKTEKVAHFGCYIEENSMRLRLRAHFPEDKEKLTALLDFLSILNKDPFSITIHPQQMGLGLGGSKYPVADANGLYPDKGAVSRPFAFRIGRHATGIKGSVSTLELEAGFIGSWSCNASGIGPSADNVAGRAFMTDSEVYPSENEARDASVKSLWQFATNILSQAAKDPKELKALEALIEWCAETSPAVSKPSATERTAG